MPEKKIIISPFNRPKDLSFLWAKRDISFWLLIFSNLLTLFFAVYDGWDFATLVWVFWTQSVIIGIFNVFKILDLKNFVTTGFTSNGAQLPATTNTKRGTAIFFALHYGFFHFVYLIFLLVMLAGSDSVDWRNIFLGVLIFLVNHAVSFLVNRESDSARKQNLGNVMFSPYSRIIPMHLTLVFGFLSSPGAIGMVIFLVIKTVVDLFMHQTEHYTDAKLNPALSKES